MIATKKKLSLLALSFSLVVGQSVLINQPALSEVKKKNEAVEFFKYFNPIQKKGYQNQAQDRIIKKKSFKVADLPDGASIINGEQGFYVTVPPAKSEDLDFAKEVLSNPKTHGLSILLTWNQLEPQEEEYKWEKIDNLLKLCEQNDKKLILRIATCGVEAPGSDSTAVVDVPKYVFDNGAKSVEYIGVDGKKYVMPVFWDGTYLAAWGNFIGELGSRYDKNTVIQSIGITGGGIGGALSVLPVVDKDDLVASEPGDSTAVSTDTKSELDSEKSAADGKGSSASSESKAATPEAASKDSDKGALKTAKDSLNALEKTLSKEYGMNQRQLVGHWKYVGDLFIKALPTARLNMDIDPPIPGRKGQDALDEISDYFVYKYGHRVYLTRMDVDSSKHGFDQYRVLLKFRKDTTTGYEITPGIASKEYEKLAKIALEDGIGYVELPYELLTSKDESVQKALNKIACHMGWQVVARKIEIDKEIALGEPLAAAFSVVNVGTSNPRRVERNLGKDVPASLKMQIEIKDKEGKSLLVSYGTPEVESTAWDAGLPVEWAQEFRLKDGNGKQLPIGEYDVFVSMIDGDHKVKILNGTSGEALIPQEEIAVGQLKIVADGSKVGAKPATNAH